MKKQAMLGEALSDGTQSNEWKQETESGIVVVTEEHWCGNEETRFSLMFWVAPFPSLLKGGWAGSGWS